MIHISHLEGEEVFGLAKFNADCFLGVDDKSHKPNYVNFSCPRVWPFLHVNPTLLMTCMSMGCHVFHKVCIL
jgi:hypothetical protein